MNHKINLLILGAVLTLAVSCKKYENGGPVSSWSVEKNLKNVWKCEMIFYPENGADLSDSWGSHTLEFTDDYTFQKISLSTGSSIVSGTWALDDKKENIVLTNDDNDGGWVVSYKYKILKIHKTALWVEYQTEPAIEAHYIVQ